MAAVEDICNAALGSIGERSSITDLDGDTSEPARWCRTYYGQALAATLQRADWPFARRVFWPAVLDLQVPAPFLFALAPPPNAVAIRGYNAVGVPCEFRLMGVTDADGNDRQCVAAAAIGGYFTFTRLMTNAADFDPAFAEALRWRLAGDLAMSRADSRALRQDCLMMFERRVAEAMAMASRQEHARPGEPAMLGRDDGLTGGWSSSSDGYIYPRPYRVA